MFWDENCKMKVLPARIFKKEKCCWGKMGQLGWHQVRGCALLKFKDQNVMRHKIDVDVFRSSTFRFASWIYTVTHWVGRVLNKKHNSFEACQRAHTELTWSTHYSKSHRTNRWWYVKLIFTSKKLLSFFIIYSKSMFTSETDHTV